MNLTAAAALNTNFSPSNSNGGRSQFELRIGPFVGNEMSVVSFTGVESLNEPFVYEVVFSTRLPEDALHVGTRGLPACLSIHTPAPHEPRVIQGLVVDFGATDTPTNELAAGAGRYFVRIAPRLWNLRNNARRRIFQGKTAIEIVCAVLKDYDLTPDLQLEKADYPAIPFEYQNNETDLAFIGRVLATAGVFFYFRHASGLLDSLVPGAGVASEVGAAAAAGLGGKIASTSGFLSDAESSAGIVTTLVLTDAAASTEQLGDTSLDVAKLGMNAAGGAVNKAVIGALGSLGSGVAGIVGVNTGVSDPLVYDANGQAGYTDAERVFSFSLADPLVPKQVRLRHWNVGEAESFNATTTVGPISANVTLNAIATLSLTQPVNLGVNATGTVGVDSPSIPPKAASVFEYGRDAGLQNVPYTREVRAASRALAQARAGTLPGWGTTDCRRIAPGYRFTLQNHPLSTLNIEYLVTEVRCEATNADYATTPNVRDYRCTFRCVPSHVDPLPQKSAAKEHPPEPAVVIGPNWGDVYCDEMERILVRLRWAPGDEYTEDGEGVCRVHLLDLWGGDGYGMQAIPRVGTEVMVAFFEGGDPIAMGQIRSRRNRPAFKTLHDVSKVGIKSRVIPSGRESEISINDNPDQNEILISSSGDLVTEVTGKTTATHAGTYSLSIAEARREVTSGETTLRYERSVTTDVRGDLCEEIGKDHVLLVDGLSNEWVGGDAFRTVVGRLDEVTQGDRRAVFAADTTEVHHGHRVVVVAPSNEEQSASNATHVEGPWRGYAKGPLEFVSAEGITLTCGDSHITLRKDSISVTSPTISLSGKNIQVSASDTNALSAKTLTLQATDTASLSGANKASLVGKSASVVLDSNATVQGSKVSLGSGSGSPASQAPQAPPPKVSTIQLSDTDGNPLKNRRVLVRAGGEGAPERIVVLDENGQATVEGEGPFDVYFPDESTADPQ